MSTKFNLRDIQFPSLHACEDAVEPVDFAFDDEEDVLCDERIVVSPEEDVPALQEYLHELRME